METGIPRSAPVRAGSRAPGPARPARRESAAADYAGLTAEFPGWRIWASRPSGLLWATRRGNVHYHDQPRDPGWTLTAGPAADTAALRALLTQQARLDRGPEPDPDTFYPATA